MMDRVRLAESDREIIACFPVMKILRPHLIEMAFLQQVRSQEKEGYRLAYLVDSDAPHPILGVAGFRISHCLAWRKFLYVDDLVVKPKYRSCGCGAELLAWLERYASTHDCAQLHLDSGLQRVDAHRFYEREKMELMGHHFSKILCAHE